MDFFAAYSQLPVMRKDAVPVELFRSTMGGERPLYTFGPGLVAVTAKDLKECCPGEYMSEASVNLCSLLFNSTPNRKFWVVPCELVTRIANGWDAPYPEDLKGIDQVFLPTNKWGEHFMLFEASSQTPTLVLHDSLPEV